MLFYLPGVASTVLFILSWRGGLLARPGVVGTWWAIGILLQVGGDRFSPVWVVGLVVSVFVAIYVSVQLKTS